VTFHRFALNAAAAAALLSGGGIAYDFSPYSGQQQRWPTQPGSFVNTQFDVPMYVHGYPDRPYNVIGYVESTTEKVAMIFAARGAKRLGADAVIVIEEGYAGSTSIGGGFISGNFYPGGFNANSVGMTNTRALIRAQFIAIKWR
jgi:hypothetical protein